MANNRSGCGCSSCRNSNRSSSLTTRNVGALRSLTRAIRNLSSCNSCGNCNNWGCNSCNSCNSCNGCSSNWSNWSNWSGRSGCNNCGNCSSCNNWGCSVPSSCPFATTCSGSRLFYTGPCGCVNNGCCNGTCSQCNNWNNWSNWNGCNSCGCDNCNSCNNCGNCNNCNSCNSCGNCNNCGCSNCNSRNSRSGCSDCCDDCDCDDCDCDTAAAAAEFVAVAPQNETAGGAFSFRMESCRGEGFSEASGGVRIRRSGRYIATYSFAAPTGTNPATTLSLSLNGGELFASRTHVSPAVTSQSRSAMGQALFEAEAGDVLRLNTSSALSIPRSSDESPIASLIIYSVD